MIKKPLKGIQIFTSKSCREKYIEPFTGQQKVCSCDKGHKGGHGDY